MYSHVTLFIGNPNYFQGPPRNSNREQPGMSNSNANSKVFTYPSFSNKSTYMGLYQTSVKTTQSAYTIR